MKKVILFVIMLGFVALPAYAITKKATLINDSGNKVVVTVGSTEAQKYFSRGYKLMTAKTAPVIDEKPTWLEDLKSIYERLADKLDVFGKDENLGLSVYPESGFMTLANPTDGTATAGTSGTLLADTLYMRITSVDYAGGQTIASPEFTCVTTAISTGSCSVTLTPTTGAAETRLWISTTSNSYYGYFTATSTTHVATTTGMTSGTLPRVGTAYYFNSGIQLDNTWLKYYAAADALVKSGTGIVHSITFSPTDAAATAGQINILDSTSAGTGTSTIYYLTAAYHEPQTIILDQVFQTGIYVDFDTTADVNVSVSYK